MVLGLLLAGCGGTGVEGTWGTSDGPYAELLLGTGSYEARGIVLGAPGDPNTPCHEAGRYSVVSGTKGFSAMTGSDVVLDGQGTDCMPNRSLFWNGGNEMWLRRTAASFWVIYQRQ